MRKTSAVITDRDIMIAMMKAIAKLHVAVTGGPLRIRVETEVGAILIEDRGE